MTWCILFWAWDENWLMIATGDDKCHEVTCPHQHTTSSLWIIDVVYRMEHLCERVACYMLWSVCYRLILSLFILCYFGKNNKGSSDTNTGSVACYLLSHKESPQVLEEKAVDHDYTFDNNVSMWVNHRRCGWLYAFALCDLHVIRTWLVFVSSDKSS